MNVMFVSPSLLVFSRCLTPSRLGMSPALVDGFGDMDLEAYIPGLAHCKPLYVIVIVVAVMVVAGGGDGCDRLLPLLVWLVVLFVVCLAGCGCHPW